MSANNYRSLYLRGLIRYISREECAIDMHQLDSGHEISVTKQYFMRLARASKFILATATSLTECKMGSMKEILKVREPTITQSRPCSVHHEQRERKRSSSSLIYVALASIRCVFMASTMYFDRSLRTKLKALRGQSSYTGCCK